MPIRHDNDGANRRKRSIADRIVAAGVLAPTDIALAAHDNSIAATFLIDGIPETVEGCGATDADAADDIVRQLQQRLADPIA
jgi:hypothetical protein